MDSDPDQQDDVIYQADETTEASDDQTTSEGSAAVEIEPEKIDEIASFVQDNDIEQVNDVLASTLGI